jgi:hypothetical protein
MAIDAELWKRLTGYIKILCHVSVNGMASRQTLRKVLTGGDRRSIAQSNRARALVEKNPDLIAHIAALADEKDWLVSQRALDLLEKFAHDHPEWVAPYKQVFIGPLAESDKWEVRLQIVRALPLFYWETAELPRVKAILRENVGHAQTFVKAWALNSLAIFAERDSKLRPLVLRALTAFENSSSKALQARARNIRAQNSRWSRKPGTKMGPRSRL